LPPTSEGICRSHRKATQTSRRLRSGVASCLPGGSRCSPKDRIAGSRRWPVGPEASARHRGPLALRGVRHRRPTARAGRSCAREFDARTWTTQCGPLKAPMGWSNCRRNLAYSTARVITVQSPRQRVGSVRRSESRQRAADVLSLTGTRAVLRASSNVTLKQLRAESKCVAPPRYQSRLSTSNAKNPSAVPSSPNISTHRRPPRGQRQRSRRAARPTSGRRSRPGERTDRRYTWNAAIAGTIERGVRPGNRQPSARASLPPRRNATATGSSADGSSATSQPRTSSCPIRRNRRVPETPVAPNGGQPPLHIAGGAGRIFQIGSTGVVTPAFSHHEKRRRCHDRRLIVG